jgi:phosphopantetheinyl transferase (holo-ACP synthase)
MKDIEIINDESGVPTVHLHGEAKVGATAKFEHFALLPYLLIFDF